MQKPVDAAKSRPVLGFCTMSVKKIKLVNVVLISVGLKVAPPSVERDIAPSSPAR
ncbi:MAG: hypothetical protein LC116_04855 [Bacteroidetes bacterium]|nr:hypothetical protein [Bacteroidota bacterium]